MKERLKLCMNANDIERRLALAKELNVAPSTISPSGMKFAWFPVHGLDNIARKKRWLWMEWVVWFSPLSFFTEYETYSGSGRQFHDLHGRYPWQREGT
jgi:hypothetical protein